jgi:hypothetical protein
MRGTTISVDRVIGASDWLRVERISSEDDIQRANLRLLDGKVDPTVGTVSNCSHSQHRSDEPGRAVVSWRAS